MGVACLHSHPVGDRLRHFLPVWESFPTDQWVLDIVRRGCPLPFVTMPQLTLTPLQTPLRTTRFVGQFCGRSFKPSSTTMLSELWLCRFRLGVFTHTAFLLQRKVGPGDPY